MHDLLESEESVSTQERQKLLEEGWCAHLLSLQDRHGLWSNSLYSGKWVSTTYTLYLLKILGLPPFNPQALAACKQMLTHGIYDGCEIRFSRNQAIQDLGVTGLVLSLCCYFGYEDERLHFMVEFLLGQQGSKGNWLPNTSVTSENYTFETTLLVLEGLFQYRQRYLASNCLPADTEEKGQEFFLHSHIYLDGGRAIKNTWTSFSFPPYWFYDVLSVLDYFQRCGKKKERRMQQGIDLLVEKRNKDGTWNLGSRHKGKTYGEMEPPGKPSKWNTLRALRVLKWWTGDSPHCA
jgi:hypothetical protein